MAKAFCRDCDKPFTVYVTQRGPLRRCPECRQGQHNEDLVSYFSGNETRRLRDAFEMDRADQ